MGILSHLKVYDKKLITVYVACAVSLICLISLLCWLAIDSQYRQTIDFAPYYLGLKPGTDLGLGNEELFDRTLNFEARSFRAGPRLILLSIIAGVAMISSLLAIVQCILQGKRTQVVLVCTLLLSWCSFLVGHSRLDRQFLYLRVLNLVPECKAAVKSLDKEWPKSNGELPGLGKFRVGRGRISNYLFLELKPPYPMDEQLGYWIERADREAIHMGLLARANWQIEFRPDGVLPGMYKSSWGDKFQPIQSYKLEVGWYLVQYKRTSDAV